MTEGLQQQQELHSGSAPISLRLLISLADAGLVIGKGGHNVQEIRDLTNTKIRISDFVRGSKERVLTTTGTAENVAQACSLIVSRILRDLHQVDPAAGASLSYSLTFLTPHQFMGALIGKSGAKIREIQSASGARIVAGDQLLPNSTERSVTISGHEHQVNSAIGKYVDTIAGIYESALGRSAAVATGQVQYKPAVGQAALKESSSNHSIASSASSSWRNNNSVTPRSSANVSPEMSAEHPTIIAHQTHSMSINRQPIIGRIRDGESSVVVPSAESPDENSNMLSQDVYIPADMVGAIIGRAGARISDFRRQSGAAIKIADAMAGSKERKVTVSGPIQSIDIALKLIFSCLELERQRYADG
eukprot:Partr_v1_DN25771_c0_g1_i2_m74454 putative PolyrC binding protein